MRWSYHYEGNSYTERQHLYMYWDYFQLGSIFQLQTFSNPFWAFQHTKVQNKMADISLMSSWNFQTHFLQWKCFYLNKISLKCIPVGLIDKESTLVHVMTWCCHATSHYQNQGWLSSLTHWGRDKMAAIFQTTFSSWFSWMKMNEFRLIFHWSLFIRVQLTIFQHWFR